MIVYLDLVIISSLLVNYAILKTIALVFKTQINKWAFFLSLLYSGLNVLLFIFPLKSFMITRYLSGIIIVIIAFPKKNIQSFIIKIIVFYSLNIMFIGSLVIFKVRNFLMLIIALFFVIGSWIIENYKQICINNDRYLYDVMINKTKLKGYFDSGNMTYDNGLPVVFVKIKYFNSDYFINPHEIKIRGIDANTIIRVYDGPPLIINKNYNIVLYAFIKELDYDLIIHRDCRC